MPAVTPELVRSLVKLQDIEPSLRNGYNDCPACGSSKKLGVWDNSSFHCFKTSCELHRPSMGNDVIGLYMWKHRVSFKEALQALSREFKIVQPKGNSTLEEIAEIYSNLLWSRSGAWAREYLFSRGFTEEFLKKTSVGFAPADCCLEEYGVNEKELRRLEFIRYGRDYFRNRVIFPVRSETGMLVHFTSRWVGEVPNEYTPKVKHTKFRPAITNYLFNEHSFESFGDALYVTEGVPDCLSLMQQGLPAVANFGLEGLNKHVQKFRKFKTVIFCFDSDCYAPDHPTHANQEKSWPVVLPQLMGIQMQLDRTTLRVWKPPAPFKDINEMPPRSFVDDSRDLIQHSIDQAKTDWSQHLPILRMMLTTGRGADELSKYVPLDCIQYALEVLS